ncbi:unnamed protein product, partial [Musa acuminata subsp. burmannicoides]
MKENLDRERNRETWQMQKTKRLVVGDDEMVSNNLPRRNQTPLMSSANIIIVIATEKASPSPWSSLYLPSKDQMGLLDQLWDDTFCRWASAPRKGPQVQLLLLAAASAAAAATGSVVQVTRSITIMRTASSSPRA